MSIEDWRAKIDDVDNQLIRLLNRRARLAVEAGKAKMNGALPVFDDDR